MGKSKPGQAYYTHVETGKTQWEAPLKKRRLEPVTREAPPLRAFTSAQTAPPQEGALPARATSTAGGDLFAGLPDATSDVAQTKKVEKIAEVKKAVTHVHCLHLLKKHTGSRRPSSWREKKITRSLEEVTYLLKELRKKIAASNTAQERRTIFEKLAQKESDCSSAHENGSLGRFGRGKMQPAFEQASFGLAVNELSGIVTTDSGVHIILRVE